MLLIVSNSMDGTTDLLLPFLRGKKEIFRFNVDLWREYSFEINTNSFCIIDPLGRAISQDSCSSLYLRKAYFLDEDRFKPIGGDLESWCQHQIRSIIDGIYWICKKRGLVRLVERNADRRLPKIVQMRLATSYFTVPQWTVTSSPAKSILSDPVVCKSLDSAFLGDFRTLFSTKCSKASLDANYPWFVQDYVEAEGDLTVVYAASKLFSFYRGKIAGEPIDYREAESGQDEGWAECRLPFELEENIRRYMSSLGLDYGRIDFLVKDSSYFFLEVNPNGQFAWLDPDNKTGLLSWIAECITT